MASNPESESLSSIPEAEPNSSATEPTTNYEYEVVKFSGDAEADKEIGERASAINNLFNKPIDGDLLDKVDKQLLDLFHYPQKDPSLRPSPSEQEAVAVMHDLHEDRPESKKGPFSLAEEFTKIGKQEPQERMSSLRGMRAVADGFLKEGVETDDMTLKRVGELTRLQVDILEAEMLIKSKSPKVTTERKQEVAAEYAPVLRDYAQTDDIPLAFKKHFEKAATWLEESEYAKKGEERGLSVPPENRSVSERRTTSLRVTDEDSPEAGQPRTQILWSSVDSQPGNVPTLNAPEPTARIGYAEKAQVGSGEIPTDVKPSTEQVVSPEPTSVEAPPVQRLFNREGGVQREDVAAIKSQLEHQMLKDTPEAAYKVAQIVALSRRAGFRLTGGQEKVGQFLQKQRDAMKAHGPRALAQFLTHAKYAGFFTEVTPNEEQYIMSGIQAKVTGQNGIEVKGLARMSMNARYLGVNLYTPEVVREGVKREIEGLKSAGDIDGAIAAAAYAREAGIDPTDVVTIRGDFLSKATRRLTECASEGRWDVFAHLRNRLDIAWKHLPIVPKHVSGLIGHFDQMRSQAQEKGTWDLYAGYAADMRELSNRDAKRLRRESTVPVTPEVKARGPITRAQLTEKEYATYLDGARPAVAAPEPEKVAPVQPEVPIFQEIPESAPATGLLSSVRTFFGRLFGAEQRAAARQTEQLRQARVLADLGRLQQEQATVDKKQAITSDNTPSTAA